MMDIEAIITSAEQASGHKADREYARKLVDVVLELRNNALAARDAEWVAAVDEMLAAIGREMPWGGSVAFQYLEELKARMQP